MLDYDKQRKLVKLLIIGIVLSVVVAIIALILIWMPEKEEEYKYQVGIVSQVDYSTEDIVKLYAKDLTDLLVNKDYNAIYNLLSKDYVEHKSFTQEMLENYLEEKGVCRSDLELIQYKEHLVMDYNNVYELEFKVRNEVYSLNVIIREISPDNYTIAFDGFIDYKKDAYSSTVSSVTFNIKEATRYTTTVEYKIKVTNGYNKDIYINSNAISTPIFLVSSEGDLKRPTTSTVPITKTKLSSGTTADYVLKFSLNNTTDYISYMYMVLSGVNFENIEGSKDLQYSLY